MEDLEDGQDTDQYLAKHFPFFSHLNIKKSKKKILYHPGYDAICIRTREFLKIFETLWFLEFTNHYWGNFSDPPLLQHERSANLSLLCLPP